MALRSCACIIAAVLALAAGPLQARPLNIVAIGASLRFFGTKQARTANIAAMMQRLHARGMRVIVYDPDPVPRDFYQWDGIHFNAAAHAKIAATLAAQIATAAKPAPAAQIAAPSATSTDAPATDAPATATPSIAAPTSSKP